MPLNSLQLRSTFTQYFALVLGICIVFVTFLDNQFSFLPLFLRILITCFSLYYVPGLLLWDMLFRNEDINLFEAMPYCFALSLVWLALLIGSITVFFHFNLSVTVSLVYAGLLVLFVINFVVTHRFSHAPVAYFPGGNNRLIFILIALSIGISVYLFYVGGSMDIDSWFFLAVAQKIVRIDTLNLTEFSLGFSGSYAFPLSFIMTSLFAYITSTEVVTVWFYLPIFLALMSVLAVYTFSKVLFRSEDTAVVSALIFIISLYYFEEFFPFTHLSAPDALNIYILFPLFMAVGLRWVYQKNRALKWFFLLLSIGAMMAVLHNSHYFYAIAVLLAVVVFHTILWRKDWWFIVKLLFISAAMIVMFVVGFEVAKLALSASNDLSFLAIIEGRNMYEFANVYTDFYPFPATQNSSAFYYWIFPLLLLMFVFARKPSDRLAATIVFAALFIGNLVYFQPQLWSLAMKTIPKLNRFFGQMRVLFAPLAWGWILSIASSILLIFIQRLHDSRKQQVGRWYVPSILLLSLACFVLAGGFLAYLWPAKYITWLILQVYPSKYYVFIIAALLLAVFSTFLHQRGFQLQSWINGQLLQLRFQRQATFVSISFLFLFLLITPNKPGLYVAQANSPDPNFILLNEYGEEIREWWEPELLSFLKEDMPENSKVLTQCWPRFYLNPLVKQDLIYDETLFIAFDPRLDLTTYIEALRYNQVEYILFTNGPSSWPSDCSDERDIMIKNFKFLAPILTEFPEVFDKVYESPLNVVFRVTYPHKDSVVSDLYWEEYQQNLKQNNQTQAVYALQRWALYNPALQTRCKARDLAMPLVIDKDDNELSSPSNPGTDVAVFQVGASLVDSRGFSLRPDRSVYSVIDGNRFNNFAITYAEDDGIIPCGAWFVVDLGQMRNLQEIEIEWFANSVQKGRLDYWAEDNWQTILTLTPENYKQKIHLLASITTSRVKLSLDSVGEPGMIGIRRFSLYEEPDFIPPGDDIALLSAGTTVEAHNSIFHPSLKIEGAIDGNDLDKYVAVIGGPDESYPHWFVLNFNQMRTIKALEIQWLDQSYGQDWEVSYYDGQDWQELKSETGWQPPPNFLYRYILPETIQASKFRLQVNRASGGRLAVRRFSVYEQEKNDKRPK